MYQMTSTKTTNEPIAPTDKDAKLARVLIRKMKASSDENLRVAIGCASTNIALPPSVSRLLVSILSEMADGNAVSVIPMQDELTTKKAADLIGVSRPFLIKQIDAGLIKCHKVGTHRRIYFKDLMEYKKAIDAQRRKALKALAKQAQELNMGY
jgi:excisionase family DNA binding protein